MLQLSHFGSVSSHLYPSPVLHLCSSNAVLKVKMHALTADGTSMQLLPAAKPSLFVQTASSVPLLLMEVKSSVADGVDYDR